MRQFYEKAKIILQKKQKRKLWFLVGLMIVRAFLEVCGISSVLPILSALLDKNFMFENPYAVALCGILRIRSYTGFVLACVGVLVLVFLVKNVILIVNGCCQASFAQKFQYDLRKKILHVYLNKDYQFFLDNNSANINKSLLDDVENTYAVLDNLLQIMTDLIVDLFLMAAVFVIDWKLSLGMLIVIQAVFWGITLRIRPSMKKKSTAAYFAKIDRNKWIYQAIQGIKSIKVSESGSFFEKKEYKADLELSKAELGHDVLAMIPKVLVEMVSILSLVIMIVFFSLSGGSFERMIPGIGALGMASIKILPRINSIITKIGGIQYRIPSVYKVSELIREEDRMTESGFFPEVYEKQIEVSHVSFRYSRDTRLILDDASLLIPVGKMIGIIGPSGEGKTTLADLLLGLLNPSSGQILVDGTDIHRNIRSWRRSIGYITQNIFLLDDSILANVAFGADEADISEEEAWKALQKAQIADLIQSLPEGIHTRIGERGVRLSGGQCQRIGIARAIYSNPQILIFDEATSSLDTETEAAVVSAINQLYGKHTIIVIAHRSKALEQCDRIFRVENGKLLPADRV